MEPTEFVEELFEIAADGAVTRTVRRGTSTEREWMDPGRRSIQKMKLSLEGVKIVSMTTPHTSAQPERIKGEPVIDRTFREPLKWWKFD